MISIQSCVEERLRTCVFVQQFYSKILSKHLRCLFFYDFLKKKFYFLNILHTFPPLIFFIRVTNLTNRVKKIFIVLVLLCIILSQTSFSSQRKGNNFSLLKVFKVLEHYSPCKGKLQCSNLRKGKNETKKILKEDN